MRHGLVTGGGILMMAMAGGAAAQAVTALVRAPMTQCQFDALVSFVFNTGAQAFSCSTLLEKLNAGDMAGAAAEFPRWCFATGKRLPGLVARRAAEAALFSKQ